LLGADPAPPALHLSSVDDASNPDGSKCPYMPSNPDGNTAGLQFGSPCSFGPCMEHSDSCVCLLYQRQYCLHPAQIDPFCIKLLEGMAAHEAQEVLRQCTAEEAGLQRGKSTRSGVRAVHTGCVRGQQASTDSNSRGDCLDCSEGMNVCADCMTGMFDHDRDWRTACKPCREGYWAPARSIICIKSV
jgi:hypothetical protein